MAQASKDVEKIQIRPIDIKQTKIRIVGDSPLIVHCWSTKAKREMLEGQMKSTKTKAKEKKRPFYDFVNSLYWLTDKPDAPTDEELEDKFDEAIKNGAKFGFPVGGIKKAANSAAYRLDWVKNQMALRGSYFLKTDFSDLAEIKGSTPHPREDMVRIQLTTDIRYRAEFDNWYMDFVLSYNANGPISLEQIVNCINAGGYSCGLGEWRPEKDGTYGMFHVEEI